MDFLSLIKPSGIIVEEAVIGEKITDSILNKFHDVPVTYMGNIPDFKYLQTVQREVYNSQLRWLILCRKKGSFIRRCPGSRGMKCCNLLIINVAEFCPLGCSYCILKEYLTLPAMRIYCNLSDLEHEIDNFFHGKRYGLFRFSTGELTDSLLIDNLADFSAFLVKVFYKYPRGIIEFKTKIDRIDGLLGAGGIGNVVVSWSVAPQRIVDLYETNTSAVSSRLTSAKLCVKNGYRVGFHFDPVIIYPRWEKDYGELIDMILDRIHPKEIAWISMGGFRYTSKLRSIIETAEGRKDFFYNEFVRCRDGKFRYPRNVREKIYSSLLSMIKRHGAEIPVYMCMESEYVWKKVYGDVPERIKHLREIFDRNFYWDVNFSRSS